MATAGPSSAAQSQSSETFTRESLRQLTITDDAMKQKAAWLRANTIDCVSSKDLETGVVKLKNVKKGSRPIKPQDIIAADYHAKVFKNNRVTLIARPELFLDANIVTGLDDENVRYICCRSPFLDQQQNAHFWHMIWENNVRVIIGFSNMTLGCDKEAMSYNYFTEYTNIECVEFNDIVEAVDQSRVTKQNNYTYTVRTCSSQTPAGGIKHFLTDTLNVKCRLNGQELENDGRTIINIQVGGYFNESTSTGTLKKQAEALASTINELNKHIKSTVMPSASKLVLLHSLGVGHEVSDSLVDLTKSTGRVGVFLSAYFAVKELSKVKGEVDINKVFEHVNKQRYAAVRDAENVKLCYETIRSYLSSADKTKK